MTISDILSRRSIRKYTNEPVSDEQLHAALEAAMAAPSAMRSDPWRFIILKERDDLNLLASVLPHGKMLQEAGAGIIVCGDMNAAFRNSLSYLLQDCAASVENLLLALHAQGLGAVWLGIHPNEDRIEGITKAFGLPEGITPFCAVAIGHPAESKPAATRFDESKLHFGRW